MEYVYAAMLLHKAGKKVDEGNVKKVLEASGVKADEARVKALVSALEGVNIDEAIEKAAIPVAAPAASSGEATPSGEAKADEKRKVAEEKKSEEQAAAGLGSLFG